MASPAPPGPAEPAAEYAARAAELGAARARANRRDQRLGIAKVVLGLGLLVLAIVALAAHSALAAWLLIPVFVAVLILSARHEQVLRGVAATDRGLAYYQRATERLAGRWQGQGEEGAAFATAAHPYAHDLDLFGPASLFQLLAIARTAAGQATLAAWLLAAAPPDEIAARQAAVAELRPALDLRERLAMLAPEAIQATPATLTAWAEAAGPAPPRAAPLTVLGIAWILSVIVWAVWGPALPIVVLTLVNLILWRRHRDWALAAAEAGEAATAGLALLEAVPALLLRRPFGSPKLTALAAALPATPPGAATPRPLHQLRRRLAWLESRHHMLIRFLDPVLLWSPLAVAALERWRRHYGAAVRGWLTAVGEFEALLALANYAFEHPADTFPVVAAETQAFSARDLGHPLLPETAVRNDLCFGVAPRLLVLSGPNMAGKSTLLRAVGLAAVLAQCGAPVRASHLEMPPLAVAACISTGDSLQAGISGFAAEVLRLKQLTEIAAAAPALVLIDELLRGTNPEDRRAGALAVYRAFLARRATGLITTHDPAITALAASLAPELANVHLGGGQLETSGLVFDYRLHPGPARAGNALALMRDLGFPLKTEDER
ncbi:MAG: MutS-related protein [Terriglobales bacterium]